MSSIPRLALVLAIAAIGTSGCATLKDEHSGHHPAATAAPAAGPGPMEAQRAAMRRMHERMMSAKTADERSALMAEHMKTMHDGMAMMKSMPPGARGGGMMGDMGARHEQMEKRMDMMVDMMQMMMDRLPPAPAK
jgi:hypothetical protein